MAKIEQLPGAMEFPVEQPHCDNCSALEAELIKVRSRLNDPHWMIQRALALLSKMKGPALALAGASALGLLLSTTPIQGLLERWLLPPQPSTAAVGSPPQIRVDSPVLPVDRSHPTSQPVRVPGGSPGGLVAPHIPTSQNLTNKPEITPVLTELGDVSKLPHGCLLHGDLKPPCHPVGHKPPVPEM